MPGHENNSDTILVVEDDVALLKLIQKRLREHGFRTEGVTSGNSALAWLEDRRARLMVLDYRLPDMLGEELLARLDAQGIQVPFVVATGQGSELLAVEMMKRGARDYLVKGAAFMKLLPAVIDRTLDQLKQEERLAEAESELRRAHDELERRVRQRTAELADANARLRVEMDERHRADEQVIEHQAELAQVTRLSTVGEMVAELAHELNQPLTAIANYAHACVHLLQSDPQKNAENLLTSMKHVAEQAARAAEIIRCLRRFVINERPAKTILDVNCLVREIAVLVQVEARTAGVHTRFELAEPCPKVLANRIQVEQVLVNLTRNALDAMRQLEDKPRVLTIRTTAPRKDKVEVAVRDTGIGLGAGQLDRVFDRFFTTKYNGMGLGLPISRSIIESHGGRLWVTPNPDCGITFRFTLPIHREESTQMGHEKPRTFGNLY